MKEWICEEVPALTMDGKVVSTMLHQEQELVRCKDCKHWMPPGTGYENAVLGECLGRGHGLKKSDWFCADGVKQNE